MRTRYPFEGWARLHLGIAFAATMASGCHAEPHEKMAWRAPMKSSMHLSWVEPCLARDRAYMEKQCVEGGAAAGTACALLQASHSVGLLTNQLKCETGSDTCTLDSGSDGSRCADLVPVNETGGFIAKCNATLIRDGNDLVAVTADHCADNLNDGPSGPFAVVFGLVTSATTVPRKSVAFVDPSRIRHLASFESGDTALIGLRDIPIGINPVSWAAPSEIVAGSPVYPVGHFFNPSALPLTVDFDTNTMRRIRKIHAPWFDADVDSDSGCSGMPLFNAHGKLLGVISGPSEEKYAGIHPKPFPRETPITLVGSAPLITHAQH